MSAEAGLQFLKVQHLRCLDSIELSAGATQNIIVGENGAGKTSILEAIYFLGRGKSFRPGRSASLIQTNQNSFTVFGEVSDGTQVHRLGVSHGERGLEVHCDGQAKSTVATLASVLPVQIIDPEVHQLIQGGPRGRREFIDWGVFHVKHEFFGAWQRYRRVLQQRNAALKQGQPQSAVSAWDSDLIEFGLIIDSARRQYIEDYMPILSSICGELLQKDSKCTYLSGWSAEHTFSEALCDSWPRDCTTGTTQVGPHRAELSIRTDTHIARNRLSRGQQKLLSIAMVLAQSIFVSRCMDRKVTLLVDEPAAELDRVHLTDLIRILNCTELQLFISTLDLEALAVSGTPRVFHVERGELSTLV